MKFIRFMITVAISFGFAWWLRIEPEQSYGWFMGLIHGGLLIPNWILSFFMEDWLVKAPIHSVMYTIDWWIMAVICGFSWLMNVINLFRK